MSYLLIAIAALLLMTAPLSAAHWASLYHNLQEAAVLLLMLLIAVPTNYLLLKPVLWVMEITETCLGRHSPQWLGNAIYNLQTASANLEMM